tara:strand:- start:565 stop:942 length:378 start_codon:yes stop_codon:yes gene_type:complete
MLKEKLSSIIERLQKGDPLSKICKDKDMPSVTSVYSWMKDDEDIKKQVMDARQLGAWSYLDEMLELLQTDVEPQKVQWNRERLHHARWMSSKLLSGTFGDKIQADVKADTKMTIAWSAEPVAEVK